MSGLIYVKIQARMRHMVIAGAESSSMFYITRVSLSAEAGTSQIIRGQWTFSQPE